MAGRDYGVTCAVRVGADAAPLAARVAALRAGEPANPDIGPEVWDTRFDSEQDYLDDLALCVDGPGELTARQAADEAWIDPTPFTVPAPEAGGGWELTDTPERERDAAAHLWDQRRRAGDDPDDWDEWPATVGEWRTFIDGYLTGEEAEAVLDHYRVEVHGPDEAAFWARRQADKTRNAQRDEQERRWVEQTPFSVPAPDAGGGWEITDTPDREHQLVDWLWELHHQAVTAGLWTVDDRLDQDGEPWPATVGQWRWQIDTTNYDTLTVDHARHQIAQLARTSVGPRPQSTPPARSPTGTPDQHPAAVEPPAAGEPGDPDPSPVSKARAAITHPVVGVVLAQRHRAPSTGSAHLAATGSRPGRAVR